MMKFLRITHLVSGLIACLGVMLCMHGCDAPAPLTEAELTAKIEKEEKELEVQKEQWGHVSGLLTKVDIQKTENANYDAYILLEFEDGRVAILEKDSWLPLVFHVGLVNEVWYDKTYGTVKRVEFETPLRREE